MGSIWLFEFFLDAFNVAWGNGVIVFGLEGMDAVWDFVSYAMGYDGVSMYIDG